MGGSGKLMIYVANKLFTSPKQIFHGVALSLPNRPVLVQLVSEKIQALMTMGLTRILSVLLN